MGLDPGTGREDKGEEKHGGTVEPATVGVRIL